ncbi:MAG: GDP-L-fucose synthase [Aliidongia sp.]
MADTQSFYALDGKRVFVAGHNGMVGRALLRRLDSTGAEPQIVARKDVDLRDQRATFAWFAEHRPHAVFVAAAKVGGILANDTRPAEFLYDNLVIETNLIEAARQNGVEKLLFLGSSCIYPKFAPQPIRESALLTGALEPTNEWYALAKIAGIKLCQAYRRQYGCDFISAMPTNLYGPHDNFDLQSSHVLPALLKKTHLAKLTGAAEMRIWGTGTARREFLHVDDLADACVFLMERYSGENHLNIGTGTDVTINELAAHIANVVGWHGKLAHELDKPDGTPRKLLDVSHLTALGWKARIGLENGLRATYDWFRHQGPDA